MKRYQWTGIVIALMIMYCGFPMLQTFFPVTDYPLVSVFVAIALLAGVPPLTNRLIVQLGLYGEREKVNDAANPVKTRSDGIDLVRAIACVLVIIQHKLISIGYYNVPLTLSFSSIGLTFVRWISQCSCPLFMMLTGFCLVNRKPDAKHYVGLVQTLIIYAVIAGIQVLYISRGIVSCEYLKTLVNLSAFWYIDMYFGLYLLAPHLNKMWAGQSAKGKNLLLATLIGISALGTIGSGWITTYWYGLYPIAYYFIGTWIKENSVKVRKRTGALLFLGTVMLQVLYTLFKDENQLFSWTDNFGGYSNGNNALPTMLCSFLLLMVLKDVKITCAPLKRIVRSISQTSLVIYLATCMFLGTWVNGEMMPHLHIQNGWLYFAVELLLELVLSVVLGLLLNKGVRTACNWLLDRTAHFQHKAENNG